MKNFSLLLCLIMCGVDNLYAQQSYDYQGKQIQLKTHIEGEVDLLWNIIDGEYRYFLRYNDGRLVELTNTKVNRKFQQEYKKVLLELAPDREEEIVKTDLTLYELGIFIDNYNQSVDANYKSQVDKIKIIGRLEGFAGITNFPFVSNPENAINPQVGFSIELIDLQTFPRHALFFNGRHVLESSDFEYQLTELALGYRYRIVNRESFSIYGNVVFGTYSFYSTTVFSENDERLEESVFDSPFALGIGADFKVSPRSFITAGYNNIVGILVENSDNFPLNLTLGYKFQL